MLSSARPCTKKGQIIYTLFYALVLVIGEAICKKKIDLLKISSGSTAKEKIYGIIEL